MKEGYIPQAQRKKILLLSDDVRTTSGIATMSREIVLGTCHRYNWVNLGAVIKNPDEGKKFDMSIDSNRFNGIEDASVFLYPNSGYGTIERIREMIQVEKPDAIMLFTDPRYWEWLWIHEREIRSQIPIIYLNIWDSLPYPLYNRAYYESCDSLLAISKQTENLNRAVLGPEVAKDKVIAYVPHGINEDIFFPIEAGTDEDKKLQDFKKQIFKDKEYEFVLMFNSRNIRRKCFPDTLLAWKVFVDALPEDKKDKVAFIAHTQPVDENGTDIPAVMEMLWGMTPPNVFITGVNRFIPEQMNLLYNCADAGILISSNEGWGLSLTEAMMTGKPIIANVTGGMQDQMRFEDENGEWIKFTEEFGSNHFGKYKKCGKWAYPVFPSNLSIVGSVPTPYIFDDRADFRDAANQIMNLYNLKTLNPEEYKEISKAAREWVTSDESMMSSKNMSKNFIKYTDVMFDTWEPRAVYDFIKIKELPAKQNKFPISL
jgi:glycosyltransferase involved in cell wall biosynthesis